MICTPCQILQDYEIKNYGLRGASGTRGGGERKIERILATKTL
jgi:hypothetical protein